MEGDNPPIYEEGSISWTPTPHKMYFWLRPVQNMPFDAGTGNTVCIYNQYELMRMEQATSPSLADFPTQP